MDRCQGLTRSGRRCSRSGPWCAQHQPGDEVPKTNAGAFAAMVDELRAAGRLGANVATLELGRTLAADMDAGQVIVCECGETHAAGRNASLVKQYREVLEAICGADADAPDPIGDLLSEILNAS
jgi:hypothetical protein